MKPQFITSRQTGKAPGPRTESVASLCSTCCKASAVPLACPTNEPTSRLCRFIAHLKIISSSLEYHARNLIWNYISLRESRLRVVSFLEEPGRAISAPIPLQSRQRSSDFPSAERTGFLLVRASTGLDPGQFEPNPCRPAQFAIIILKLSCDGARFTTLGTPALRHTSTRVFFSRS